MRILVVGAGGIGGYFGGRLLEAGRDVTFLVRERRRAQLEKDGLRVRSPHGDIDYPSPPTVSAGTLRQAWDLILLSCKAYDLDGAITAFAPAVGEGTAIIPLLNGMRHVDLLEARFGPAAVLGGQCFISAALDDDGRVMHMNDNHLLTFGERFQARSARSEAILAILEGAGFDVQRSERIVHEMWEKWVFIASLAGITCLMRASVGEIVRASGRELTLALLAEAAAIATRNGFPPGEPSLARARRMLTPADSTLKASMLRDIERGGRTEGEHVLGDLLRRAGDPETGVPLLRAAYVNVTAYERARAGGPVPAG